MSHARDRILGTVRESLVRAILPDAVPALTPVRQPRLPAETLVERFTSALENLKGVVRRVPTAADAAAAVNEIAGQHGATQFMSWDDGPLACPGLLATLTSHGLRRVSYDMPADPVERNRLMDRLGGVTLGVSGADAALADSGALVLVAGPGRGRLVSLLPPVHVAVVPIDRLVSSLGVLLEDRPGLLDEASNVVAIAGPSRTADIEMTLTHGVHGPKHVYVVFVG